MEYYEQENREIMRGSESYAGQQRRRQPGHRDEFREREYFSLKPFAAVCRKVDGKGDEAGKRWSDDNVDRGNESR